LKNNLPANCIIITMLILLISLWGTEHVSAVDKKVKTIAVLPVHVNSSQDLDYIKRGMVQMFNSRLSWNKKIEVISGNQIKNLEQMHGSRLIHEAAEQTQSSYVLSCIVTELSGSFSIDAKVYDIENMQYMTFFENSKKIDDLIKKTDHITAAINKKVFGRVTTSWKSMEMEKQEYINKLKRQNPENLIKHRQFKDSDDSPGWKIWKHLF